MMSRFVLAMGAFLLVPALGWEPAHARQNVNFPCEPPTPKPTHEWVEWRIVDGFPSDFVGGILPDRDGVMWVLAPPAVVGFDGVELRVLPLDSLIADDPLHLRLDGDGWIAIVGRNGVWRFGEHGLRYLPGEAMPDSLESPPNIMLDPSGQVLSAGEEAATTWALPPKVWGRGVTTVLPDPGRGLWLGTRNGLFLMSGPEGRDPGFELILDNVEVTALSLDREGNLWLGTRNDGLKYQRPTTFTNFEVGEGEEVSQDLIDIHQDTNGDIWTGNRFGGLFRWEEGGFRSVSLDGDPFDNEMFLMADGPGGRLLFGTEHRGVWVLDSGRLTPYLTHRGPIEGTIVSLFSDGRGRLWVGRYGRELGYYEAGGYTRLLDQESYPGKMVFDFLEDSRGNLWIGGSHGVVLLPGGDSDPGGLVRLLTEVPVLTLHEDETGTIWMASPTVGLIRMDPETLASLTIGAEDGLGCDEILQLLEDGQGFFWMGCPRGILRVSRTEAAAFSGEGGESLSVAAFNVSDGVKGLGLVGIKTRDGHLLLATDCGVVGVDPAAVSLNAVPPGVVIHSASVDGREGGHPGSDGTPLQMKSRALLQIEARAVTFRGTEALSYRYRLVGRDEGWTRVFSAGALTVEYPDLSPGEYLFQVTAANNHGFWNEEGTSLAISVRPTLSQRAWFRGLFLFSMILALGASVAWMWGRQERFSTKYRKNRVPEDAAEACSLALVQALEKEELFRDRGLSLKSLAAHLGIPPHHLSQVINQRFKRNYFQLINEYRVREAKRILLADGGKDPKIITIAFDVGFNTLNSFNRAFKRHAGMTPTEFRKTHRSD